MPLFAGQRLLIETVAAADKMKGNANWSYPLDDAKRRQLWSMSGWDVAANPWPPQDSPEYTVQVLALVASPQYGGRFAAGSPTVTQRMKIWHRALPMITQEWSA